MAGRHQSRIDNISETIRILAFNNQDPTIFEIGEEVEIASQVQGFIGSYYEATIIYPIGSFHYKIRYKTLVNDDETVPLEEFVIVSEVRPAPPVLLPDEMRPLKKYDIVDVYDNEGWWFGVVTGKVGQRYNVYFPTTDETVAYSVDQVRFHQEWDHGQWVHPYA